MKRLSKEHFKVMMKVWLNAGHKTYSQLLNDCEIKFFNDLLKEGYIEIVDRFYPTIPYKTGFSKVMDNFVENLEIMNAPLSSDEEKKKPNAALDIKIQDLDLSARAYNCMVMNDIKTLGDLIKWNKKDLLGLRNLGRGTLNELDQIVDYYGLSFGRK